MGFFNLLLLYVLLFVYLIVGAILIPSVFINQIEEAEVKFNRDRDLDFGQEGRIGCTVFLLTLIWPIAILYKHKIKI